MAQMRVMEWVVVWAMALALETAQTWVRVGWQLEDQTFLKLRLGLGLSLSELSCLSIGDHFAQEKPSAEFQVRVVHLLRML
jgi:hypothetical protein